ncbi:FAD-dependent monooxygenase [Serratia sp. NA_13]|uniref:FAD-dependent monooxygenase n=1 Tax=Serratia sp. NA_13 TaxID=3415658 RepID=UPI004046A7E8
MASNEIDVRTLINDRPICGYQKLIILLYARHPRGLALISICSPGVQRMYFQCDPAEDVDQWSDARIWNELESRQEKRAAYSRKTWSARAALLPNFT